MVYLQCVCVKYDDKFSYKSRKKENKIFKNNLLPDMILHMFASCETLSTILTTEIMRKQRKCINLMVLIRNLCFNLLFGILRKCKQNNKLFDGEKKLTEMVSLRYVNGNDYPSVLFYQMFFGKQYNLWIEDIW